MFDSYYTLYSIFLFHSIERIASYHTKSQIYHNKFVDMQMTEYRCFVIALS